jgi:hypothetical protein
MDDRPDARVPTEPVRWWKRVGAAVLGAGAIAAAVTAVITAVQVIHPPDREEFAEFGDVTIRTDVPVSEYEQRISPPKPVSRSLGDGTSGHRPVLVAATDHAPTQMPPATARQTPPDTTPDTTLDTSPDTETPVTAEPTEVTGDDGRKLPDPDRPMVADQGSVRALQAEPIPPGACSKQPQFCAFYIRALPTDAGGETLSQQEAKAAYAEVIEDSRTVSVKQSRKSRKGKRKREMLGVVVNANVALSGLRGKRVVLSWTFWRGDGDTQVYGTWLNENHAYELVAGSDHDSGAVDFWIPLPKAKGPYFIRSKLTRDGQVLATHDSKEFS